MKEFTQTNLSPGNCWQTCIASLLDVDPESLPPQERYDWRVFQDGKPDRFGPGYYGDLQAYLRTHHGLAYMEIRQPEELWTAISVAPDRRHMMTGHTVRSATNGGRRHVVVARGLEVIWDPHPSRAGLLEDGERGMAFLVPYPKLWTKNADRGETSCACPACGRVVPPPPPEATWP